MGSSTYRRRIDWKAHDDSSCWAECEIGGERGVVALVVNAKGGVSATAIVEIGGLGASVTIKDAQGAFENWLEELGAASGSS